jgi:hypothetical protein
MELASVVPLFTRRTFGFGSLQAGASLTVIAVKAVDVAAAGDAILLVRVHAQGAYAGGTTATIVVGAYASAPSAEDPTVDFIQATPLATARVLSTTAVGTLFTAPVRTGLGCALQIQVTGTRGPSGDGMTTALSADLVLRPFALPQPAARFIEAAQLSSLRT